MLRIDQITAAIQKKENDAFDALLTTSTAEELNQFDQSGWTPLTLAAATENLYAATKLLEKNVNVDIGITQIKQPFSLETLHLHEILINIKPTLPGATAFYFANFHANIELMKLLIKFKANVNLTPSDIHSPLLGAIILQRNEAFDVIMTGNPNVNLTTLKTIPIFVAVENNNVKMVRALLEKNAKTDDIVEQHSLLASAAQKGYLEVGELLLAHSSLHKVNFKNGNASALNLAAKNGHGLFVKMLLKKGIKDQLPSNNPETYNILQTLGKEKKLNMIRAFLDSPRFAAQTDTAITPNSFDTHVLFTLAEFGTPIKLLKEIDNAIESDTQADYKISHQMAIILAKIVADNKITAFEHFDVFRGSFSFLTEWRSNYSKRANSFKDLASFRSLIATQKYFFHKQFGATKNKLTITSFVKIGTAARSELFKYFYESCIQINEATKAINPINLTQKQLSDYHEDLKVCLNQIVFFETLISKTETVGLAHKPEVMLKKLSDDARTAIETLIKKIKNPTVPQITEAAAIAFELKKANKLSQLSNAIKAGKNEEVETLITRYSKKEINEFDDNGWTPLMLATAVNNNHAAQKLLENGADANQPVKEIQQPFPTTKPIVIELIKLLNASDSPTKGIPPLYLAGLTDNLTLVSLLIKHHARVSFEDDRNYSLLLKALRENNAEAFSIIFNANAEFTTAVCKYKETIFAAVNLKCLRIVESLLKAGASPNAQPKDTSLIERAVTNDDIPMIELLVKYGVHIDGHADTTPLMLAAQGGNTKLVEFLLKNGANLFIKKSTTALHLAAENGHVETVHALLLVMKDDINTKNAEGYTALQLAGKHKHVNVINAFINPDQAKPNTPTNIRPDKKVPNVFYFEADSNKKPQPNIQLLTELAELGAPRELLKEITNFTKTNNAEQTIVISSSTVHSIAKIICDNPITTADTENYKVVLNFYRNWKTLHATALMQCKNEKDFHLFITHLKTIIPTKPSHTYPKNLLHTIFVLHSELMTDVFQAFSNMEFLIKIIDIKNLNDASLEIYLQDILFCETQLLKQCNDILTTNKYIKIDATSAEISKQARMATGTLRLNIAQEQENRLKAKNSKPHNTQKQKKSKKNVKNIPTIPIQTNTVSASRTATPPPQEPSYNELLAMLATTKARTQELEETLKQEQTSRDLAELKIIEMESETKKTSQQSIQQIDQYKKLIAQLQNDKTTLAQEKQAAELKQHQAETIAAAAEIKAQQSNDIKTKSIIQSAKQKQQMQAEIKKLSDDNAQLQKEKFEIESKLASSVKEATTAILDENTKLQFEKLKLRADLSSQQQMKVFATQITPPTHFFQKRNQQMLAQEITTIQQQLTSNPNVPISMLEQYSHHLDKWEELQQYPELLMNALLIRGEIESTLFSIKSKQENGATKAQRHLNIAIHCYNATLPHFAAQDNFEHTLHVLQMITKLHQEAKKCMLYALSSEPFVNLLNAQQSDAIKTRNTDALSKLSNNLISMANEDYLVADMMQLFMFKKLIQTELAKYHIEDDENKKDTCCEYILNTIFEMVNIISVVRKKCRPEHAFELDYELVQIGCQMEQLRDMLEPVAKKLFETTYTADDKSTFKYN